MEHSSHPEGVLGPHAAALRAALSQPFLRLNFVTLWVRDQERSRRFFVETLYFEAIVDVQTPDLGRWIIVAPPAAGWLTGTEGAGFPGLALVVPTPFRSLRAGSEAASKFFPGSPFKLSSQVEGANVAKSC